MNIALGMAGNPRLAAALRTAAALAWLVLAATAPLPARADAQSDAIALVEQVHDAALDAARGGATPAETAALRAAFDGDAIGKVVLGKYWTTASATDRAAFVDALLDAITASLAERLAGSTDRAFVITGTQLLTNGDILVKSRFDRLVRDPVLADWRLHRCATRLCIGDVIVNGASVSIQRRDEVAAQMAANGGSVSKLTADLRAGRAVVTP